MNELTRTDVIHILRLCGWSLTQIADYFDMDRRNVVSILQRRTNPLRARLSVKERRWRKKHEGKVTERPEALPPG